MHSILWEVLEELLCTHEEVLCKELGIAQMPAVHLSVKEQLQLEFFLILTCTICYQGCHCMENGASESGRHCKLSWVELLGYTYCACL